MQFVSTYNQKIFHNVFTGKKATIILLCKNSKTTQKLGWPNLANFIQTSFFIKKQKIIGDWSVWERFCEILDILKAILFIR